MTDIFVSTDITYQFCARPRNKQILKKARKDLVLKLIFTTQYFWNGYFQTSLEKYDDMVSNYNNEINNCSDVDTMCNYISQIIATNDSFFNDLRADEEYFNGLFMYLSHPAQQLITFVRKHKILEEEYIQNICSKLDAIENSYKSSLKTISESLEEVFKEGQALLHEFFPKYRSAKRGNPFLRGLVQIAGGILGGYLGASAGIDISNSMNIGTMLGEAGDSLMMSYTSGSRQDKINSFENIFQSQNNLIFECVKVTRDGVDDDIISLKEIINELENQIVLWMEKNSFHKNDVKAILNEINYIFIFNERVSRFYLQWEEVIEQLRKASAISFWDKLRIKKLLYKGV